MWKNGKETNMVFSSEARICHWQRDLGGYLTGYPGDENVFSFSSASRWKKQSSGNIMGENVTHVDQLKNIYT